MIDKLEEIAKLEDFIADHEKQIELEKHELAQLRKEQQAFCTKKMQSILKNKNRYKLEGLKDALQEKCKYVYVETKTYRSYYDTDIVNTIQCSKCNMLLNVD